MVGLWGALAVLNQSQALALSALLLALCWLGGAQLAWLRAERGAAARPHQGSFQWSKYEERGAALPRAAKRHEGALRPLGSETIDFFEFFNVDGTLEMAPPSPPLVLVVHAFGGSPRKFWYHWLAAQLGGSAEVDHLEAPVQLGEDHVLGLDIPG